VITSYNRPRPIVGLLTVGSILILLEGLIELGFSLALISLSIPGVIFVVPGLTIALGILLLLLTVVYARTPTSTVGMLVLVLGALSFLLGGGFVVGAVLIVVAGALAVFADWVSEELVSRQFVPGANVSKNPNSLGRGPAPTPASVKSAGARTSPVSAPVVIYRTCPTCRDLNPQGSTRCWKCGGALA
jgi:type III secretory pathway component EscS